MLTQTQRDDAKEHFVDPMRQLFGPRWDIRNDVEAITVALEQYVDELAGYSAEELKEAWGSIRRTHVKYWPPLADCVTACEEARRGKYGHKVAVRAEPANEPVSHVLSPRQLGEHLQTMKDLEGKDGPLSETLRRVSKTILARHHAATRDERHITDAG